MYFVGLTANSNGKRPLVFTRGSSVFYYFQKYHRLRIFKKSWGIQHLPVAIMLTFVYKDKNLFPDEKGINNRDYRAG